MKAQQIREDLDTGIVPEKLDCEKGGKIFSRSKDLKFHIKGPQECVCEECGQTFTRALQLKRHNLKEHSKTFPCITCGKCFGYKHHLDRHSHVHDSSAFTCRICHCKIKTKSNFERHMSQQHNGVNPKNYLGTGIVFHISFSSG